MPAFLLMLRHARKFQAHQKLKTRAFRLAIIGGFGSPVMTATAFVRILRGVWESARPMFVLPYILWVVAIAGINKFPVRASVINGNCSCAAEIEAASGSPPPLLFFVWPTISGSAYIPLDSHGISILPSCLLTGLWTRLTTGRQHSFSPSMHCLPCARLEPTNSKSDPGQALPLPYRHTSSAFRTSLLKSVMIFCASSTSSETTGVDFSSHRLKRAIKPHEPGQQFLADLFLQCALRHRCHLGFKLEMDHRRLFGRKEGPVLNVGKDA